MPNEWPEDPGPGSEGNPAGGDPSVGSAPASGSQPAGAQPPAAAGGPAGSGQPGASADPNSQPAAGGDLAALEQRFSQLETRTQSLQSQNTALAAQNQQLRRIVATALGKDAVPGEPPPPEDPKMARAKEVILKMFPQLGSLDSTLKDLTGFRTTMERSTQAQDQAHADRFINAAVSHAASQMLGEGKKATDLSEEQQAWLRDSFITWVSGNKERAARYEQGDMALTTEFWTAYHAGMRASATRATVAGAAARVTRAGRLPQAGPSAAPAPQAPNIDFKDEAAVHKAGWQHHVSQAQ